MNRTNDARSLSNRADEVDGRGPLVATLRHAVAASPGRPTLARVARTLGLSARSLQRRLRALGTTFQAESGAARVREAQAMMLTSDASLTAIAFDVGCASTQHFSTLFRRVTGQSPSAWRARHRPGSARGGEVVDAAAA